MARRTWVLGGGGARGAAQVGVLLGLFEAGVEPPSRLVGTSVGALNAAAIAAYPTTAGAEMLREIWLSQLARDVFRAHPVSLLLSQLRRQLATLPAANIRRLVERALHLTGIDSFEQLSVPLAVVATDIGAGVPAVFTAGPLERALLASTAIPGVFPPVSIDGRDFADGGIVDNTPLSVAVRDGSKEILAIDLMAGAELTERPASWPELVTRTLQLTLHHRMLADYERLRDRGRVVVLCPVLPASRSWDMERGWVETVIAATRKSVRDLLAARGSRLFRHSGIHYLEAGVS